MPEEGSESLSFTEHLLKQFEIEEMFYTGEQPVCVFLHIIRHQQDLLKEQGAKFHCGAIYQGCFILCLTIDFLSLLFNSAEADK